MNYKKVIVIILLTLLTPIVYFIIVVIIAWHTEYKPSQEVELSPISKSKDVCLSEININSALRFLSWNIGYSGLGAESDFFYDGGKMSIPPKKLVTKYTKGISELISREEKIDFFLFQEVDENADRSYNKNQVEDISEQLQNFNTFFSLNYDVKYMPMPVFHPMKMIKSGLLSNSKYEPIESYRISLPNISDFPRKLFYLKRCILLQKFKVSNGKLLIVINTHFEAYDKGGTIKKKQQEFIKNILNKEYAAGNYVLIGGDWNIAPPGFNVHQWEKKKITDELYLKNLDADYMPGWKIAADFSVPTNRKNDTPLNEDTYRTVIDYFMVSPNIEIIEEKGLNEEFKYSDHNPIFIKIRLK